MKATFTVSENSSDPNSWSKYRARITLIDDDGKEWNFYRYSMTYEGAYAEGEIAIERDNARETLRLLKSGEMFRKIVG